MIKKTLLILLLIFSTQLSAQVKDKFKINIGSMFVTNFETDMQLTPKNLPVSARVNTKDTLGMTSDTNVFRLDGYYRFSDTHSIDFSYFSVKSDGHKNITKDIKWGDSTISSGATVDSHFDMDIYKINYAYSFYHNEKVELGLTAGLHVTTIGLGLKANGTVDGVTQDNYSSGASVTIPLPVFGLKGEYTIIDNTLFVNYKTEYFFLEYEDYRGALVTSALNLEYHFIDNYGVGVGYNSNKIILDMDNGDKKLQVKNDLSGVMVYLTYIY